MFTEIINSHVKEESEKLSVFQQGGVYLATKKIGKNNPKEAEIRADNAARQEWNRTVDVALVEGVPEEDILTVKREKITDKTLQSIRTHGWLPDMFHTCLFPYRGTGRPARKRQMLFYPLRCPQKDRLSFLHNVRHNFSCWLFLFYHSGDLTGEEATLFIVTLLHGKS